MRNRWLALWVVLGSGCGLSTSGADDVQPSADEEGQPPPTGEQPPPPSEEQPPSTTPPGTTPPGTTPTPTPTLQLPPLDAGFDYQLGGPYAPASGVQIVSRDRTAPPAPGLYNICYVNAFQIQPDEESFWTSQHPDLILRNGSGTPIIDADWNEMLVDVSTDAKRTAVAAIVGDWIIGCKQAGFDAIEIDNLDSYARSQGGLTVANNVAAMRMFADVAHANGLAIAQKNSAELVGRKAELGTDFAIAEECNRYSECAAYRAGYGDHVLVIEYRQQDFAAGCAAFPSLSIVLRNRSLVVPTSTSYLFDDC